MNQSDSPRLLVDPLCGAEQFGCAGRKTDYTVRVFALEQWGQIDRFATFFGASFPDATTIERRAVSGVGRHFRKALVLRDLAKRLVPGLKIDQQQLDAKGFTPADRAVEIAAVAENVFTELYSSVDCARKVLYGRYPVRGLPNSTRKTFERARSGRLDEVLPEGILSAFRSANWFEDLRLLRDELTHSDIGSVYQCEATGTVSYMHTSLGTHEKALIIEDVFARIDVDIDAVNLFLGSLFYNLNLILKAEATQQICGIHQGKILLRELWPEPVVTFNSGKCLAVAWIEVDGKPTCPLLCDAYWRAKEVAGSSTESNEHP